EVTLRQVGVTGAVRTIIVRLIGDLAAGADIRALLTGATDIGCHLVAVLSRAEGAGLSGLVEWSGQLDGLGTAREPAADLRVDGCLDDDAGACGADLPGVDEATVECVVHRGVEVCVGEDDVRVLSAQLEGDALDGLRRLLGDELSGHQATGE